MKIWTVPGGNFLVETERTKVGYIHGCGGFGLNDAERFDESGSYVELSPTGEKRREWGRWLSIGFDETLAVWNIHRVIGETLYVFYWHQTSRELPETTAEPILTGLAPHSSELSFDLEEALRRPSS